MPEPKSIVYDRKTSDLTDIEYPFIIGYTESACGRIPLVSPHLSIQDWIGTAKVRTGFNRDTYRVVPGLYGIGRPTSDSPVLITGNYKLTFDALRSSLPGQDAWILIIDTHGINVWCAAGKGTFSTDNVIRSMAKSRLSRLVTHRTVILPQLAAPGVSAPKVSGTTGFKAVFGPIRASDIPKFLSTGMQATPAMREVSFDWKERLVLTIIEVDHAWKIALITAGLSLASVLPYLISAPQALFGALAFTWTIYLLGIFTGTVLVPWALPVIPFRSFILKGYAAALPVALLMIPGVLPGTAMTPLGLTGLWLCAASVSAWQSLNFTGSTVYTGHSGVRREIALGIRPMALVFALGLLTQLFAAWQGGN